MEALKRCVEKTQVDRGIATPFVTEFNVGVRSKLDFKLISAQQSNRKKASNKLLGGYLYRLCLHHL